jgi:hypothetical protein
VYVYLKDYFDIILFEITQKSHHEKLNKLFIAVSVEFSSVRPIYSLIHGLHLITFLLIP